MNPESAPKIFTREDLLSEYRASNAAFAQETIEDLKGYLSIYFNNITKNTLRDPLKMLRDTLAITPISASEVQAQIDAYLDQDSSLKRSLELYQEAQKFIETYDGGSIKEKIANNPHSVSTDRPECADFYIDLYTHLRSAGFTRREIID
jgi:hypothetical protein